LSGRDHPNNGHLAWERTVLESVVKGSWWHARAQLVILTTGSCEDGWVGAESVSDLGHTDVKRQGRELQFDRDPRPVGNVASVCRKAV
jgi:hypothetical protein